MDCVICDKGLFSDFPKSEAIALSETLYANDTLIMSLMLYDQQP
jgi:hypothetical protein